jgi:hypothetical protein
MFDIPTLSPSIEMILSDDNVEDVCIEMDNDASLVPLYDTHMHCDVTTPSYTSVNDVVLSPQRHSHECNAFTCHDISAMCETIIRDCNTSTIIDSKSHVITNDVVTIFVSHSGWTDVSTLISHIIPWHLLLQCQQPSTISEVVKHFLLVSYYLTDMLSLLPLTMLPVMVLVPWLRDLV